MKKEFNTTGTCYPHLHYMMDNSSKLQQIIDLVEYGKYFTINRPRQFGKTTTLFHLNDTLSEKSDYFPIQLNFQGVDSKWHQSDAAFARMFVNQLQRALKFTAASLAKFLKETATQLEDMDDLSNVITDFIHKANKKVVLLIDEVDASSDYEPFLRFLGMLRTKYLARMLPQHATFHSIVLVGVHDIKSLKYKLRNPEEAQNNSPWNIAVDFEVDMSFQPHEIAPMLEQYSAAEGVKMNIPVIAERLYFHTAGYPFLISKLCKNIADKVLPKKQPLSSNHQEWTVDDVEASVQLLLQEVNTNFDSLIQNIENHKDLHDMVYRIAIESEDMVFNQYNPTIRKGILYGIFKRHAPLQMHNHIYAQLIYEYLASKLEAVIRTGSYNYYEKFLLPNNELDVKKVLLKFQQFMQEEYSGKDQAFLEREWRLLFLAFIRPIINGNGYTFKEPQVSEEKRLDIVVTYFQYQYVMELKRWDGEKAHHRGINQLADYLERRNLQEGFLLIFEYRTKKTWRQESITHQGKDIFAVWI